MNMNWGKLLSSVKRKDLTNNESISTETSQGREEFERDYDRILFCSPIRRLADKTQVFPLEKNDSVRNRLTHSHEVSNLARSIGTRIVYEKPELIQCSTANIERVVPPMLAATGLAHDLGNPPFGHQGEKAIQQWFIDRVSHVHDDFKYFNGNAQTFRLLTKLQILNDDFGLNLTCGTLAALVKYPVPSSDKSMWKNKFSYFRSEEHVIQEVWEQTGLSEGVRHPLAYIMEACDDIAYSVIDAEDIVKKQYASFYDLMDHLECNANGDQLTKRVIDTSLSKNKEFKSCGLSPAELNDISMQMFRVKAIFEMVKSVTESFYDNFDVVTSNKANESFELIKFSRANSLCYLLKEFDRTNGFSNKSVLELELRGDNFIKDLMDMLWGSIEKTEENRNPFEKYSYSMISESYRRVYQKTDGSRYAKCQLLSDFISGMTEKYLISVHNKLKGLSRV